MGVIGHIDHGKTSLVAALTGVDTDTHPEEKRRGITIDLGFASFIEGDNEFALIDAPGHQKYIGNLLAGVSSIDVGLLVVACDQGIQEQTLEHASILQNLGVDKLVVAISRIDVSDAATLAELKEELEVFLSDYGFSDIPVMPISSVTREGLDQLKAKLSEFARTTPRSDSGPFRMPIDRVFSVPGRGCVVAGTPWSGQIRLGDTIRVAGRDTEVRVRELEVHGEQVEASKIGRRTAMNITGISATELSRGDELIAEASYVATKQQVIAIQMFRETTDLKCPATVQLHTATQSCEGRITGVRVLKPSERTVAVIETDQAIVTDFGQQFLLRRPYPVGSFAGGRFLSAFTDPQSRKRELVKLGQRLQTESHAQRLAAWVDYCGEVTVDAMQMELNLGIPNDELMGLVKSALAGGDLVMPTDGRLVSKTTIDRTRAYAIKILKTQAEETDDAWADEESLVKKLATAGSATVAKSVIKELIDSKEMVRLNRMVAIASEDTKLSKKQRARLAQVIELYAGDRSPPTTKEAAAKLDTTLDGLSSPLRFATQQGFLTDLGNGFLVSTEVFQTFREELKAMFAEQSELSASEIKDQWQITRKHAIPLLEHCDKMKLTTRNGNQRSAGPEL